MTDRRWTSNGRILQAVSLGHAVVGAVIYRRELAEIGRRRLLGSVGYRGERANAFWFLLASPLLWMLGGLLHRAERSGDAEALRATSRVGLLSAAVAAACLPSSGLWIWLGVSLRGLRDAARSR